MSAAQRLPMEIILHIVDSIADHPGTIYRPSDPVTKTLLSFTRVCRATHAAASNHLRRQCMYIDDAKRLTDCIDYLKATKHLVPEYNAGNIDDAQVISQGVRFLPITSLYLFPGNDWDDIAQMLTHIVEFFALVRSSLTRLILDAHFCHNNPTRDEVRRTCTNPSKPNPVPLWRALFFLPELRDFVCVRSYHLSPFLDTSMNLGAPPFGPRQHLWSFWPNVRRLALQRASITRDFWCSVHKAKQLDTLILFEPNWTEPGCQKTAFLQSAPAHLKASEIGMRTLESTRSINIDIVEGRDLIGRQRDDVRKRLLAGASDWPLIDPDNLIKIRLCDRPATTGFRTQVEYDYENLATVALRDEIWSWEGETIS